MERGIATGALSEAGHGPNHGKWPGPARAWILPALAAAALLCLALALYGELRSEYDRTLAEARRHNRNLALALEGELSDLLTGIDSRLSYAGARAQAGGLADPALAGLLSGLAGGTPAVGHIGLADRSGHLMQMSLGKRLPSGELADLEFFGAARSQQKSAPTAGLLVAHPLRDRLGAGWMVPLARPLTGADGSFAGTVHAALDSAYLDTLLDGLDVGPGGAVAIYLADDTIIGRAPLGESYIGKRERAQAPPPAAFQAGAPESGGLSAVSELDRVERLVSYARVGTFPLVVAVGVASGDLLAPWYRHLGEAALIWLAAAAVTGTLTLLTLRAHRQGARLDADYRRQSLVLRSIIDSIGDAVVVADEAGRLVVANPAARALAGRPGNPNLAEREAELQSARNWAERYDTFLPGQETPLAYDERPLIRAIHGQETKDVELSLRLRAKGLYRGAEERIVSVTASPIRDAAGRPHGGVAVVRDITERRQAEEQINQSQRLQSLGRLTGGVAHEFNNLLMIILGNAELLAERAASQPALAALVGEIDKAGRRSAQLTRQLLAFSRRQPLRPQALDLEEVFRRLKTLAEPALGEAVHLEFQLAAGLRPVRADPGQLDNALLNLVLNARDAMPEGGHIVISAENVDSAPEAKPDPYIAITVADDGEGMSEEVRRRAVEPFFTTKDVGKGTGLGLSMVDGFARQSGGDLTIDSAPGQGTRVCLLLPAA